jgi:uncharacterized repeat protein (TIGR01451 family)
MLRLRNLALFLACLLLFAQPQMARAEPPAGWSYISAFNVTEQSGAALTDVQAEFSIDTSALTGAGQMQPDGDDIRFFADSACTQALTHWLEGGIGTAATKLWVKIPALAANGTVQIFMAFGNPAAASVSSITALDGNDIAPNFGNSATDQVAHFTGQTSVVPFGNQRGFRFTPVQDIYVSRFGKREPNGTTRYVTLFDLATQAIISQQQVSGPAAQYVYGAELAQPLKLISGTQYILALFNGAGEGYYFGESSQINAALIYGDMRYCGSCTQDIFPNQVLVNYHFGYPDFLFFKRKYPLSSAPLVQVVPPTISDVANQTINEDGDTGALSFTVGDIESGLGLLSISVNSNNTNLAPNANILIGGSGANRTVTVTPEADLSGASIITLSVTNAAGGISSDTFLLTVNAVNDAPTLTLGSVATHAAASTGAQTQVGFASVDFGPPDEDATQAVSDYLIDNISDPAGVLVANSLDIANDGTLTYTLTGIGGTATITTRVRDNGGTDFGGVDTSSASQFSISVVPGADLQIAKTNNRDRLINGEQTVYAIVVANAGPNAVTGATLTDTLPSTLINGSWMCVQAASNADCPTPGVGSGDLSALINLGVNQYLRFDLTAQVDGASGAFVSNTASVTVPEGITVLNTNDDSATDQDPILPIGVFANGFETTQATFTVPGAKSALEPE